MPKNRFAVQTPRQCNVQSCIKQQSKKVSFVPHHRCKMQTTTCMKRRAPHTTAGVFKNVFLFILVTESHATQHLGPNVPVYITVEPSNTHGTPRRDWCHKKVWTVFRNSTLSILPLTFCMPFFSQEQTKISRLEWQSNYTSQQTSRHGQNKVVLEAKRPPLCSWNADPWFRTGESSGSLECHSSPSLLHECQVSSLVFLTVIPEAKGKVTLPHLSSNFIMWQGAKTGLIIDQMLTEINHHTRQEWACCRLQENSLLNPACHWHAVLIQDNIPKHIEKRHYREQQVDKVCKNKSHATRRNRLQKKQKNRIMQALFAEWKRKRRLWLKPM